MVELGWYALGTYHRRYDYSNEGDFDWIQVDWVLGKVNVSAPGEGRGSEGNLRTTESGSGGMDSRVA